jgi:poly-gamma-glutamate synthase PgsB/CapB
MSKFDHLEHRENVALALSVARHLNIADDVALAGMYCSHPDIGALRLYRVNEGEKSVRFVNALAANDPESTLTTWRKVREIYPDPGKIIVLLNTRADRFDRSRQLLWMAANYVKYDHIVSIGEKTSMLAQYYRRYNIDPVKVIQLGMTTYENVFQRIFELTEKDALVLAIGNMGAGGLAVANCFRDKSKAKEKERG